MDEIDREAMRLEAMLQAYRPTPHKELPMTQPQLDAPTAVRLPADIWRQIDRIRAKRADLPTRSQILRELLAAALAARAAAEKDAKR